MPGFAKGKLRGGKHQLAGGREHTKDPNYGKEVNKSNPMSYELLSNHHDTARSPK